MNGHHFILTCDRLPVPEPWTSKIYETREEAVLAAKAPAVRLGKTITVTRITSEGCTDEVEVTDVSTFYLSTRKAEVKA